MRAATKVLAAGAAGALLLGFAGTAVADNIHHDVVVGGNDTITAGNSTTISYRLQGTGSDGCDASGLNPVVLAISPPAGVTVSPASVTFTACQVAQPVTFSSSVVGNHQINNYRASGGNGSSFNTNPANFVLNVMAAPAPTDTTPPVITPAIAGTVGDNGWYTSDVELSWTVADEESAISAATGCGAVTVSADQAATSYTCEATSGGGTASETVSIKRDATPPALNPSVSPNPVLLGEPASAVPNAGDVLSGLASTSCDAVDTSRVGSMAASCEATDNAGNKAIGSANYSVIYNWTGFFRPVDSLPKVNVAKAGSAIPVKFSLSGNQGLNILAVGSPKSNRIACDTSAPLDAIEETMTAGGSGLSYDVFADQYTYVWKTDKAWAGTCRQFEATLNDGTSHRFHVNLTK